MKNTSDKISALVYRVNNEVYFQTSVVINKGIFIAENNNHETILKTDIEHTNHGSLSLSKEIKDKQNSLIFSIISGEIKYKKKLEWK
jgi:membrane-bound lytic murein transglycosylase MltF